MNCASLSLSAGKGLTPLASKNHLHRTFGYLSTTWHGTTPLQSPYRAALLLYIKIKNRIIFFLFRLIAAQCAWTLISFFPGYSFAAESPSKKTVELATKYCKKMGKTLKNVKGKLEINWTHYSAPKNTEPHIFTETSTPSNQVESLDKAKIQLKNKELHPFATTQEPSEKVESMLEVPVPPKEDLTNHFKSNTAAIFQDEHPHIQAPSPVAKKNGEPKSLQSQDAYYLEFSDLNSKKNFQHKLGLLELRSTKKAYLILKSEYTLRDGMEEAILAVFSQSISDLRLSGGNYSIDFSRFERGTVLIEFHHWTWLKSNESEVKEFFVYFFNKLNEIE